MRTLATILGVLSLSALGARTDATAAPSWQAPVVLSQVDRSAAEVQVGFAASGAATAVWQEHVDASLPTRPGDRPPAVVRARTRAANGDWTDAVQLSESGIVSELQLAMSPSGRALAAWRRTVRPNSGLETVYGLDGWRPWGDPAGAATPPGSFEIALDAVGNALALSIGSYPRILTARYRPVFSPTWAEGVELDRSPAIHGPAVAFDPAGSATAVWAAVDSSNVWVVRSARHSVSTGTWSAPVRLAAMATSPSLPRVAVDGRGNVLAVWVRRDEERQVVEAARRDGASEQWTPPVEISVPSPLVTQPEVAVSPAGDAIAVWGRSDGTSHVVQGAALAFAGGWTSPTDLSTPGRSALNPAVAVDPRGNAVAVWQRYDGNREVIQASLRPAAIGRWLPPSDLGVGFTPSITLDRNGNGLAAWVSVPVHVASLVASGPIPTEVTVPREGRTGQAIVLSAAAAPWGFALAGQPRWELGDGRVAVGSNVTVAYPRPGRYTVTVTHTDAGGAASSSTAPIEITAPPEPLLIAPGRGIGQLRLGMPAAAVTRLLGAPQSEQRSRYPNDQLGRVARYPRPAGTLTVGYRAGAVVLLATDSRTDRTSTNVGPGSPRAAAAGLPGFSRTRTGYARQAKGAITLFGAKSRPTITHVAIAKIGYLRA